MHTQITCLGEIPCVKEGLLPTPATEESAGSRDWFHSAPPASSPWLPPIQVQGFSVSSMLTSLFAVQGNVLFGLWMFWNVRGVKEVIQGHFQIMDNIIHAEHILREVMAERRALCQTTAGNWKEWSQPCWPQCTGAKYGLDSLHTTTQLLGSPRAPMTMDTE